MRRGDGQGWASLERWHGRQGMGGWVRKEWVGRRAEKSERFSLFTPQRTQKRVGKMGPEREVSATGTWASVSWRRWVGSH